MDRENENVSQSDPEISAVEAALAQLRPRREARFADEVKSRIKDELLDKAPVPDDLTATVRIPLTHYIRIAQFNAAAGGLLAGLFLGILLGGSGVFFALGRSETEQTGPSTSPNAAIPPYLRMLADNDTSFTPLEQALFAELEKEAGHGRR